MDKPIVDGFPTDDTPRSLNRESRSVEATITTDTPVRIYDWREDEDVDEVLLPSGMMAPRKMHLRIDHRRYDSLNVIGRVKDYKVKKRSVEATLFFSDSPDVEPIFRRVADGTLDEVSISAVYDMKDTVRLEPGESREFDGVTYRAKKIPMRIVRKWFPDETSVVDRGADPKSTIRSKKASRRALAPVDTSPKRKRGIVHPLSGESGYEKREAGTRRRSMLKNPTTRNDETHTHREDFMPTKISKRSNTRTASASRVKTTRRAEPNGKKTATARSAKRNEATKTEVVEPIVKQRVARVKQVAAPLKTDKSLQQAERRRVSRIMDEAGSSIPQALVQKAIRKGWSIAVARKHFFNHLQTQSDTPMRQQGNGVTRAAAGHVRGGVSIEALQFAVATRAGIDIHHKAFSKTGAGLVFRQQGFDWIHKFNRNIDEKGKTDLERHCDDGHRYVGDSPRRICERILAIEGVRHSSMSEQEIVQRAFTSLYMARVFGPMIALQVIQAYEELEDTTVGWVDEADFPDFRPMEAIGVDYTQGMTRHIKGGKAKEVGFSEYGEFFAVDRYSGRFSIDEMDIINDQIGLNQIAPDMMGQMARQLNIDLPYVILLSNPNLRDGNPLFHSSRNNIVTAAPLTIPGISAVAARFGTQTITMRNGNTRTLNSRLGHLVTSLADEADARVVTRSTNVQSGASVPVGDQNPHAGRYSVHADGRIDAGVENPRTGAFVAGSTANYFGFERAQGRPRTLQRAFLRASGRVPQLRSFNLVDGVRGIAWDIFHDVGCGVKTARGVVRAAKA